jgi:N-sulfoglucosamine sulfohydrolase
MKDYGRLNQQQMLWFRPTKPLEELYDCAADPWQFENLADDAAYANKLEELRQAYDQWIEHVGDLSALSEPQMVMNWWSGKGQAPKTELPKVVHQGERITLSSATPGASIGYKFRTKDAWSVYTGSVNINGQDSLYVIAQRIGYYKSDIVIERLASQ